MNGDPVAAGARIFRGAMVALDANGNAIPATSAAPLMRGVAMAGADNTDGSDGDMTVETRQSVFLVAQAGLDRTNIGEDVFVVDDATVGAAGTLVAGKLVDVSAAGAWVDFT
jgi:hypothetical protein